MQNINHRFENHIDSYGVDHSGFTTRDEIEYQMARQQRENQMIKNYNNHGITQDYPQAGTNFWGNSPDNNFGFGSSNIANNIENMQNTPVPNVQNQAYGTSAMAGSSSNSSFSNSINPYARIKQLLEQNDYTQNQAQSFEQKVNYTQSNNINSGYGQSNTKPQAYNMFGTSPQNAIETTHKALDIEPVGDVTKKTTLNRFENIKRELQQDALDVAYGASRTINGMTAGGWDYLGNKLGFDSRMNGYLDNLSESERVQRKALADVLEFGGAALPVGIAINAGVRALRVPYNAWQIGRAYDKLRKDPFIGNGKDVIAKMKDHNGENVLLQRGEVIRGRDGNIKASGNDLLRETGTKRNFGLNKAIYKHDITKEQATKIPRYIRGNPVETNQYGQSVYEIKRPDGNFRIVTSSKDADKILSSMYKIEGYKRGSL